MFLVDKCRGGWVGGERGLDFSQQNIRGIGGLEAERWCIVAIDLCTRCRRDRC